MELEKHKIRMEYKSELESRSPLIDELLQTKEMLDKMPALDADERIKVLSSFSSRNFRK